MRSQAFKPRPDDDPWRCLVAKVIERAVLNLQSANQSTWARTTAAMFLAVNSRGIFTTHRRVGVYQR